MPYTIVLAKSAVKELNRLPNKTHDKVIEHLRQLESDPRMVGVEKLTTIDAYRLRVGNYRIVFEIHDTRREVKILMVEDRKQVYQRLRRKK